MATKTLDADQVIKAVYNPTTASFSTSPSYVDTTVWLNAITAATTATSTAVNILPYKVMGVTASWATLNHTDGTLQFQGSVDGVIYENIGSATTLATAAGHQSYSLVDEPYKYVQLVYTHGTNTTGTISASYILRA